MERFKSKQEKDHYFAPCGSSFFLLVFTIFTVGDSYFRLQKIQNIRMSGAEFDAIMYGVTDEQRQMCENNPDIVLTGTVGVCGWVEKNRSGFHTECGTDLGR